MLPLHFTTWGPAYLWALVLAGVAIYQTMRMNLVWRIPVVLLWSFWAFAGGQAAGFHIGPQAIQWFVISIATLPILAIPAYFGYRSSNRNQFADLRHATIVGGSVKLRATSKDDLDLLAGWFADPSFVTWWGGKPKSREEVATKYLNDDETPQAFVVEAAGEPIGYIQAWSDEPPDGGIDIVLKPDAQGKGLGIDAIRTMAEYLRAAGWRKITVDPLAQNYRAIKAFERAGFVKDRVKGAHLVLAFAPAVPQIPVK